MPATMKPVHEDISDLLGGEEEDRFACPKEIRKKAMDFLARREYGQAELAKKLADKGYKRAIVEDELQRLTDEGLQSDTRFAESFVQSRINQGKGPQRIRADLRQRGVRGVDRAPRLGVTRLRHVGDVRIGRGVRHGKGLAGIGVDLQQDALVGDRIGAGRRGAGVLPAPRGAAQRGEGIFEDQERGVRWAYDRWLLSCALRAVNSGAVWRGSRLKTASGVWSR